MTSTYLQQRILRTLTVMGALAQTIGCSGQSTGGSGAAGGGGANGAGGAGGHPVCDTPEDGLEPCCKQRQCFTQAEIEAFLSSGEVGGAGGGLIGAGGTSAGGGGVGGAPGSGGAGGTIGTFQCPQPNEIPPGLCYWFEGPLEVQGDTCCYDYWEGGCCGRPFVVAGAIRRADVVERSDWSTSREDAAGGVDHETAEWLARAWLEDARLEHASIAAFARFTLELLALGAPGDLVEKAQAAGVDEAAHARACFALASRYAGRDLGPGEMDLQGVRLGVSLEEAAVTAVIEGCVGETVAAMLASRQLERASDPHVVSTLARIADDEAAHAELAWAFVAWAISRGGDDVVRAVARAFEASLAAPLPPSERFEGDPVLAHAHGRLTPVEQAQVRRRALLEVVRPCAAALLGGKVAFRPTAAASSEALRAG